MSDAQSPKQGPVTFEEIEPGIGLVTMNRPEKLNAINLEVVEALERLYETLEQDEAVRVIILTGAGRGFCSGADLFEAASQSSHEAFTSPEKFLRMVQKRYSNLTYGLRKIPQPVIAAVNGAAAGGGFGLALAADVRLAAPEAFFVASFINLGLTGGEMGTSYILPRLVGMGHAAEVLLTGRRVKADEAERMGLVNRVVSREELIPEAVAMARLMLGKSFSGLRLTKRVLEDNLHAASLRVALELEDRNQTILVTSHEFFKKVNEFTS